MRRRRIPSAPINHEQLLLGRARRCTRKGEDRKAMLALREACFGNGQDARLWVLYGVQCFRARRRDEAVHALKQALWLRQRAHDDARARVIRALIAQAEDETATTLRAA
jgi:Flp pilus assembly protein TadD